MLRNYEHVPASSSINTQRKGGALTMESKVSKTVFSLAAITLLILSTMISHFNSFWLWGEPDMPESLLK